MRTRSRGPATLAIALDLAFGEPPPALHPTIWMGRGLAAGRASRRARGPRATAVEGALVTLGVVGLAAAAGYAVDTALRGGGRIRAVARSIALKPALALRGLLVAGVAVERALRLGQLDHARALVARHLVSRDTTSLSPREIAGAAISSLAENLSDSVVAPLLAFRYGGLAGAYAYRALNTADAMVGYHTPELEWFGKVAARGDDAVNLGPARLTALLIAATAPLVGGSIRTALRMAWRDAGRTPSPNAGWPMAAMAGALDVALGKRGVYDLHDAGRPASADDIRRARRIVAGAAVLAVAVVEMG